MCAWLLARKHAMSCNFYGAVAYIAALGIIGAAAYIFVVGDIKRVEIAD